MDTSGYACACCSELSITLAASEPVIEMFLCAHNDASLVHVALQCIPAVFLAVSTGLIAAPDRAWVILVMIIEPCHASLDLTGYPMGTVDVAAPYGCAQCKFAIVCDGYRFVLILEWRKRYNRSK